LAWLRIRDAWLVYAAVLAAVLVIAGFFVSPRIDFVRSGRALMARVEQRTQGVEELGLIGFKDQFLLQSRRPVVHFGHARWREAAAEAADGAAWLAEQPGRALVTNSAALDACFRGAAAVDLGRAHRDRWYLVTGPAEPGCVRLGDAGRARVYVPPNAPANTEG
jgi:hypothetical protein